MGKVKTRVNGILSRIHCTRPGCNGTIKVRNVYQAGSNIKTYRGQCRKCQMTYTGVTFYYACTDSDDMSGFRLAKELANKNPGTPV